LTEGESLNIDERLEALTQSVELMHSTLTADLNRMRTVMDDILVFAAQLLNTAQAHEPRNDS
jgi:hypothetical protein